MRGATFLLALALLAAVPAAASAGSEPAIRARIEATLPAELGVVDLDVPAKLAAREGAIAVDWTRAAAPGWVSVKVTVGRGRRAVTGWVKVELGAMRPVVRAARALAAGAVIGPGDVVDAVAPVAGLDVAAEALVGLTVSEAVAPGAVLAAGDVALPPPLARGAAVDVEVRSGAMVITGRGTLERAARLGDEVGVRLAATKKILRGRLTAGGVVVEVSR